METYFLVAAILLGAIVGSFINALSYRFNTGRGMGGRSYCDTCGHTLGVSDLIPIFSYFFLRGRCRYCRSKISIQNPIVELVAAALAGFIYLAHPSPLIFAFWFVVWMILLFVVVYDLRHTIIPWVCSILLSALALFSLFFNPHTFSWGVPSVELLLAGPLLALPLFLLSLISSGRWMGWGDSGLELALGWLLGLSMGGTALMLAFWTGAAIGILLMLFSKLLWQRRAKRLTMLSEIPFAPFLVLGAFLVHFFHVDFFSMVAFW